MDKTGPLAGIRVITSYSIHYTKLYDTGGQQVGQLGEVGHPVDEAAAVLLAEAVFPASPTQPARGGDQQGRGQKLEQQGKRLPNATPPVSYNFV